MSNEELILRAYVDDAAVQMVRRLPPVREEPVACSPLVSLVAGLTAQSAQYDISVQAGEISVRLGKKR